MTPGVPSAAPTPPAARPLPACAARLPACLAWFPCGRTLAVSSSVRPGRRSHTPTSQPAASPPNPHTHAHTHTTTTTTHPPNPHSQGSGTGATVWWCRCFARRSRTGPVCPSRRHPPMSSTRCSAAALAPARGRSPPAQAAGRRRRRRPRRRCWVRQTQRCRRAAFVFFSVWAALVCTYRRVRPRLWRLFLFGLARQ